MTWKYAKTLKEQIEPIYDICPIIITLLLIKLTLEGGVILSFFLLPHPISGKWNKCHGARKAAEYVKLLFQELSVVSSMLVAVLEAGSGTWR